MKISLLLNSTTEQGCIAEWLAMYEKRIGHYIDLRIVDIPSPKSTKKMSEEQVMEKEGELTLKNIPAGSMVVLLDEKGREMRSPEFAQYLQQKMNSGIRNLIFVCGGPYGIGKNLRQAAHEKISLSKMTFPHQLARIIFAEQLYRAFTILRNEPYHHE